MVNLRNTASNLLKKVKEKSRLLYLKLIGSLKSFGAKLKKFFVGIGTAFKNPAKFIKNFLIIIVIYGFLINYVFTYFLHFDLNVRSIIAFGLVAYFIKYELVSIILSIRGASKLPPIILK
jgi:uncharacterized membrane protein YesL